MLENQRMTTKTRSQTIDIVRSHLVDALMCANHIAGCPHPYEHVVAYNPDYPEETLDIQLFLDDRNSYTWGDASEIRQCLGIEADAKISDEQEMQFTNTARSWIEENLLTTITLDDGQTLQVTYR